MNVIAKGLCRIFQAGLWCAMWVMPWNQNKGTLSGEGTVKQLPKWLKEKEDCKSVLIVTDEGIYKLGMADPIKEAFEKEGVKATIFHGVIANPTIDNIEDGLKIYKENSCDAIVALGGGSSMDCAKGIGARVARPRMSVPRFKGLLKISLSGLSKLPPLVAIPTTSGTGSEATVAAVISDPRTHEKYSLTDFKLMPRYVVMDPELTVGLPPFVTATTGMDALTHAVECYVNRGNNRQTKRDSIDAVVLIEKYLKAAFDDGKNLEARNMMQKAAYLAGKAFTRNYVGYVHATAHTFGGYYRVPHGLANAVILPYVLEAYGKAAYKPLAELADVIHLEGDTREAKAKAFIRWIRDMNASMGIPDKIRNKDGSQIVKEEDLPQMIKNAVHEANPLYPVPVIWGKEEVEAIYRKVM